MPLKGRSAVDKAMQKTKVNANKDIRAVYLNGLTALIKQNPVDEGRAKNNWFLTKGQPFGLSGRDGNKSGDGSQSSADTLPGWVLNKKIFFTNNLPYIETLEYGGYPNPNKGNRTKGGFSDQAVGGWVRKTLRAMAKKIRQL